VAGWSFAVAASLAALVIGGVALWSRVRPVAHATAQVTTTAGLTGPLNSNGQLRDGSADDGQSPREHAREIEDWLASLPREPVVVRVGTRAAVARLEDRIAQVDDILTVGRLDGEQPDRLVALQQERNRLVGSLAQVRYAEFVAAGSP
jgi:hypothetical protein